MKLSINAVGVALLLAPASAGAQTWAGQIVTNFNTPAGVPPASVPLRGDETVNVRCISPCTRTDNTTSLEASILLFASANDVRAANRRADAGASLVGALDLLRPAAGSNNRIGGQALRIGEQTAVGVTYTRTAGRLDFGVGYATTGDRNAGKVGVGFSW